MTAASTDNRIAGDGAAPRKRSDRMTVTTSDDDRWPGGNPWDAANDINADWDLPRWVRLTRARLRALDLKERAHALFEASRDVRVFRAALANYWLAARAYGDLRREFSISRDDMREAAKRAGFPDWADEATIEEVEQIAAELKRLAAAAAEPAVPEQLEFQFMNPRPR
jgi:hypothetical protein